MLVKSEDLEEALSRLKPGSALVIKGREPTLEDMVMPSELMVELLVEESLLSLTKGRG